MGSQSEALLRDYIFCLTLVSMVAKLETDIETLSGIPNLKRSDKLGPRLIVLRDHFQINQVIFDAVDQIREARNSFVHDGFLNLRPGCTRAEMPGKIVTFLQQCGHPDYP